MESQKKLIEERDWNCLVILDACRFDFFKEIYGEYLSGQLNKALSSGSSTEEWLIETFEKDFKDTVYVSSSAYVNSKGIKGGEDFDAAEKFHKVIDVWDKGWNRKLGTVPPIEIRKTTALARAKYPDKRLISHFMQPHEPFLGLENTTNQTNRGFADRVKENKGFSTSDKIRRKIGKIVVKVLGQEKVSKVKGLIRGDKSGYYKQIVQKYGEDVLKRSYRENLEIALNQVQKLAEKLPGKVVVTSDHGELLGEDTMYRHPMWSDHPVLREVPWLEVFC